jgi:hypothetical protein
MPSNSFLKRPTLALSSLPAHGLRELYENAGLILLSPGRKIRTASFPDLLSSPIPGKYRVEV